VSERRKSWRIRAVQVALVAVSVLLLVNVVRGADLGRAWSLVARSGAWSAIVLAPALVAACAQTAGWLPIFAYLGHRITAAKLALIRIASDAVYFSAPAGTAAADSLSLFMLGRRAGMPLPEALAGLAGRRMVLVITNGLYLAAAFVFGYPHLVRASEKLGGAGWLAWFVLGAACFTLASAVAMGVAVFSGSLAVRLQKLLERLPLGSIRPWLMARAAGFEETDRQLHRLGSMPKRTLAGSIAAFLVAWFAEFVETVIAMRLVGVTLGFTEILALEVLVSLLRSFAFVLPSGIGVQDAGYVTLLGAFGVADPGTTGVAFLVVKRAKEVFWIAIGYGLLALPYRPASPAVAAELAPVPAVSAPKSEG
jgi:glycosyltransferase 2 family protein